MSRQTLLIVINNFGKGGAETLLVGTLPQLNQRYEVILVALSDECDFSDAEMVFHKKYTLGFNSKISFLSCIYKLRKIIQRHKPAIVHSHLVYSSIIARIACPLNIPLVYTIHNVLSQDIFDNSKILRLLEKASTRKEHSLIAVSEEVLTDYKRTISKVGREYVLKNYINDAFIHHTTINNNFKAITQLRLVAVGNIKVTKNYIYLVEAFKQLQQYRVTLDVYGQDQGNLLEGLQKEVAAHQLPVVFKGKADNVEDLLLNYDAYVLCSKFEGFGIAAVEAMALGLPLLLTELPVLRNVTMNNALFFDISNPKYFVELIKAIFNGKFDLHQLSEKGIDIARNNYSKEIHLKNLYHIYDEIIQLHH